MFVVVPRSDRLRSAVEDAIRKLYWKRYNAVLHSFARTIVADLRQTGSVACAAGLRFGHEKFLSECYIELPIEQVLEDHVASAVRRERIVEVCHLAGPDPGRSLTFVQKLIDLLRAMDTEWAIFTATKPLRCLLQRSGLPMVELGCADRSSVPNPDSWGNYFEHDPRIMAVGHRFASAPRCIFPAFTAPRLTTDARVF